MTATATNSAIKTKKSRFFNNLKRYKALYLLMLPVVIYFLVFRYYPMILQFVLAFKDYKLGLGIWKSPFVGFKHYQTVLNNTEIINAIGNSLKISLMRIIIGFPFPIILAILLFDLSKTWLRRICQTILYIPHFFSWVIVFGVTFAMFSHMGFVNQIIRMLGFTEINFLNSEDWFYPLVIGTGIWKELGWNTIIYMASLSSISPSLYESAMIDGANPVQRIWYITLPSIRSVTVFLLTLSFGGILYAGGEQLLLFYSPATLSVGDIIDTWVYRFGIGKFMYSLSSAVTLFQSLMGLILILIFNKLADKFAQTSIW